MIEQTEDKAGKAYWDDVWQHTNVPEPVDPRRTGLDTYVERCFDAFFRSAFAPLEPAGKSLLEIGCARSAWLPYFAREFGFTVAGLDYSEIGCAQEEQVLAQAGVAGRIVCANMFSPPDSLRDAFDVVISFGVAEHFRNTAECIAAFGAFVRPGGIVVTVIPNMTGAIGLLQNVINRPVYAIHVPLGPRALRQAHEAAGLHVRHCRYFMSTNFGVNNLNGLDPGKRSTQFKSLLLRALCRLSKVVWAIESHTGTLPAMNPFAPYIICIAAKSPSPQKEMQSVEGAGT